MGTDWYHESACFVLHSDNKQLSSIYAVSLYLNDNKSVYIELLYF